MSDKPPNFHEQDATLAHTQSPRIAKILDQYLEDIQNGRACSREELLRQHPELKDSLVEYLDGLEMVAGLGVGEEFVPKTLGDFEIIGPIGQGAMGTVYRANQLSLKRAVALKVLRYSIASEQASKRFEREAELVATLRHNHIVPIFATGEQDNSHFLAMQLIDGPSLSQWCAEPDADRDPTKIARWCAQVARGLAHAHQRDVIHRDVKPSNLLKDGDHIWLTDFGLARRHDDLRMSMTGAMLGTPNYMSPEQASPSRHPIDFRTDIYSLGATLFELLTGRCVFVADTPHAVLAQLLTEEAPQLGEVLPRVSADLETIVMKCLEKEPGSRYETAEKLAEDLEAFAEGRSIKARRPSMIERASRWHRQNSKAFSWASTAAIGALTLIGITVATWIGYRNAITGSIKINSDEGPIVGRLIDENGEKTPTFTIPSQHPLSVPAGEYTLQMWAGGKLGENQQVVVDARSQTTIETSLSNDGIFPERTVEGFPAVLPAGDHDDLIFFHESGVSRIDGGSGETLWIAKAETFVKAVNELTPEEEKQRISDSSKVRRNLVRRFDWQHPLQQISNYGDRKIPAVVKGFPDINDDGVADVMISCLAHTTSLVFDGSNGDLIWSYIATPKIPEDYPRFSHHYVATYQPAVPIGDIDDDGVADFASIHIVKGNRIFRWIEAFSSKTGDRIWQFELPEDWFDKTKFSPPDLAMLDLFNSSFRHTHLRGNHWQFRSGSAFRNSGNGDIKPWPMMVVDGSVSSGNKEILLSCGDRFISIDAKTGNAGSFNGGQQQDLGFMPALPPRLITSAAGKKIGLLFCEAVTLADPNKGVAPLTRFSLRSTESGEILWQYDANCDPGWLDFAPDWPVVADVVGDSDPEIIISEGNDLQTSTYKNADGLGSLQVLDARSGEALWDVEQAGKVRTQDRQIQNVLIGPDEDGDQKQDVYVVTPMLNSEAWIFVDILRGTTGERLRTIRYETPAFKNGHARAIDLETPFFMGDSTDPNALLVVSTKAVDVNSQRQSTCLLSVSKRHVARIGDQLEYPLLADGDGDGCKDLFLIKPKSKRQGSRSAQLVSFNAAGSRGFRLIGGEFTLADDVDNDGVKDLVSESQTFAGRWRVTSGVSGKVIKTFDFEKRIHEIHHINGDIDGDGLNDYIAEQLTFGGNDAVAQLSLIAGKTGKVVWSLSLATDSFELRPRFACEDLNRDGVNDLLIFHRSRRASGTMSLQLTAVDGSSGETHWSASITEPNSNMASPHMDMQNFDFKIVDVDNDKNPDIVCPIFYANGVASTAAFNGITGARKWELKPHKMNNANIVEPWRCEVIPAGEDSPAMIVSVEGGHNGRAKSPLQIDFYRLDDGSPVSSWTSNDRIADHLSQHGKRPLSSGIPFAATHQNRALLGICLMNENGNIDVAVIDGAQMGEAKLVQRHSSKSFGKERHRHGTNFVVADVNNDGSTEVIFDAGSDIVAIELATGNELARRTVGNVLTIRHEPAGKYLEVIAESGDNSKLKLVDIDTFDVIWDLNCPRQKDYIGLLSPGEPLSTSGDLRLPRTLFGNSILNTSATCRVGTPAEFRGRSDLLPRVAASGIDTDSSRFVDPRLVVSFQGGGLINRGVASKRILRMLSEEIPVALGAIIFPLFFLRRMIGKSQWTLRSFLMLPLLFVVPFLALRLPFEFGSTLASGMSVPDWTGKLIGAALGVPTLVFVALCFKSFLNLQWKHLFFLLAGALCISLVEAGVLFVSALSRLPDGGCLQWWNLELLMMFSTGAWVVGAVFCVLWIYNDFGSLLKRGTDFLFLRSAAVGS